MNIEFVEGVIYTQKYNLETAELPFGYCCFTNLWLNPNQRIFCVLAQSALYIRIVP